MSALSRRNVKLAPINGSAVGGPLGGGRGGSSRLPPLSDRPANSRTAQSVFPLPGGLPSPSTSLGGAQRPGTSSGSTRADRAVTRRALSRGAASSISTARLTTEGRRRRSDGETPVLRASKGALANDVSRAPPRPNHRERPSSGGSARPSGRDRKGNRDRTQSAWSDSEDDRKSVGSAWDDAKRRAKEKPTSARNGGAGNRDGGGGGGAFTRLPKEKEAPKKPSKLSQERRRRQEKLKAEGPKIAAILAQKRRPPTNDSGECAALCRGCLHSLDRSTGGYTSPSLVYPGILIGDRDDAMDDDKLKALGVSYVLNTAQQLECFHEEQFVYLHLPLMDAASCPIREYFTEASDFIDDALKSGRTRVFVHCISGVSRSVVLVAAWMMERRRVRLQQALSHIRKRRPIIHPNEAFLLALADFEIELFGESTVADSPDPMWSFYGWNEKRRKVKKHTSAASACCVGCSLM